MAIAGARRTQHPVDEAARQQGVDRADAGHQTFGDVLAFERTGRCFLQVVGVFGFDGRPVVDGFSEAVQDAAEQLPSHLDARVFAAGHHAVVQLQASGGVHFAAARSAHQVHHVLDRVDARKRHVPFRVRVRMAGYEALLGLARVFDDLRYSDSGRGAGQLRLQDGGERRNLGLGRENDVLAALRTALRRARGLGVGEIFGQESGFLARLQYIEG